MQQLCTQYSVQPLRDVRQLNDWGYQQDSGPLDLEEAAEAGELVEVEGEAQEEEDQAAEAEKDREMDAPLTEEAAYPTESQVCIVPVVLPQHLERLHAQ